MSKKKDNIWIVYESDKTMWKIIAATFVFGVVMNILFWTSFGI